MRLFLLILVIIMLNFIHSSAEPGPGDIFREYLWKGPFVNAGNWQRMVISGARTSANTAEESS